VSYDLAVFDPAVAPRTPRDFLAWYREQVDWKSDQRYDDPARTTEPLRRWLLEIIPTYPAMNAPYAKPSPDDSRLTGYSIGAALIFAAAGAGCRSDGCHRAR
jgi:hypothetical protein